MQIVSLRSFKRVGDGMLALRFNMGNYDINVIVESSSQGEKVLLPRGYYIPDKDIYNALVNDILHHWAKVIDFGA